MSKKLIVLFSILTVIAFCQPVSAEMGVTDDTITLGHFGPMTGPGAYVGKFVVGMIQAWAKDVNERGGIHGRKIQLLIEDNKWDPNLTKTAFFKLKDKGVFSMINVYGSSPCVAIFDDVQKAKIPVMPTMASASSMFIPFKRYWFMLSACGLESGVVVADYIFNDLKLKDAKVAICYQDDEWGKDGRKGLEIGVKKYGSKLTAAVSFKRGTKDLSSQITSLMMSKATHVYFVGMAPDYAMFIKQSAGMNFKPQFIGDYVTSDFRVAKWAGPPSDGAWSIGITGLPGEKGKGIERAEAILEKYMPPKAKKLMFPTQFLIMSGTLLTEEALKACGRDLTREKFVDALGKVGSSEIEGLIGNLGYSASSRKGVSQYRIFKFHQKKAMCTVLSDWRYPSVKAN